ncbi:31682_t:CDS:2, partial [Racocetra persica]
IFTTPEPTSGAALIFMLNLLEEYGMSKLNFRDQVAHEARIQEIMSKEYATSVRANISDNETFPPPYYNPMFDQMDDHGTTHVSVLDINNMAVSFTST